MLGSMMSNKNYLAKVDVINQDRLMVFYELDENNVYLDGAQSQSNDSVTCLRFSF
jgi:hypothetical protein